MINSKNRECIRKNKVCGGNGFILREDLLSEKHLGKYCKVYCKICLKSGCEIGYHEHHGNTETYYILSGSGVYQDNNEMIPIEAGVVAYCEDGNGHGIRNTGEVDLEFIALILQK